MSEFERIKSYSAEEYIALLQAKIAELEKELRHTTETISAREKHIGELFEATKRETGARCKAEIELNEYQQEDNKTIEELQARLDEAVEIAKVYCSWCHSEIISDEEVECAGCRCKKFLSEVTKPSKEDK